LKTRLENETWRATKTARQENWGNAMLRSSCCNSSARKRFALAALALLVTLAALSGSAAAQTELYAGKQIRMVIGSGAGGGYDVYARFLARHLGRHIPGNPTIVSQNMPAASGLAATNWGYTVAPKDGTVIVATYNALLDDPLYGSPVARFDPLRFESVGSIAKQQTVCATWHASPIKTIAQARTREVTVSATGASGDRATMPRILNAMLGTRFKVINGYGTTESMLAVERGEVDGMCGVSWSTLKVSNPDWVQNNRLNVMIQAGAKAQAGLPNVPLVIDLASNAEDRALIELLFFPQEMGRPFVMPPDTPKELVTTIRRAFDATMKDPAFLAEAEKSLFDVDPLSGEEMQRILERAYATPKALVARAAEFNGSGGP
jgi:tripartite-type tricarboxylate transporter receptor subunit TctC